MLVVSSWALEIQFSEMVEQLKDEGFLEELSGWDQVSLLLIVWFWSA